MGLGITELFRLIGDENITMQNLDESMESFSWNNGTTMVTFGTAAPFGVNGPERLGLVVWIDREAARKALASVGDRMGSGKKNADA